MSSLFWATAISRKDDGVSDGIHLLWTAPYPAGYSVNGYDIQRRPSQQQPSLGFLPPPQPLCYTLTPDELTILHQQLRVGTRVGRIGLRGAACPELPRPLPDEPAPTDGRPKNCIDFRTAQVRRCPNPRVEQGVTFEGRDRQGRRVSWSEVKTKDGFTGLDCGFKLEIRLEQPSSSVQLSLVHFAVPAKIEVFGPTGERVETAGMSVPKGQAETFSFKGKNISRLSVDAPLGETLLPEFCFDPPVLLAQSSDEAADQPPGSSLLDSDLPELIASFVAAAPSSRFCLAYDLNLLEAADANLRSAHDYVSVTAYVPSMLAIALREGKAVDARRAEALSPGGAAGPQEVVFEGRAVERVLLYVTQETSGLTICVDVPLSPAQEEEAWRSVPYLVRCVQLPVRAVNPALTSAADEEALASSRLLPGEVFDRDEFREVAHVMNESASRAAIASPMWYTTLTRERTEDPFIELRGWPYALSLLVDPAWRRMLGFGHLDAGSGLTLGAAYDYRITGYFRRRDIEEQLYGFHTVPSGTILPVSFHLGPLLFNTPAPTRVTIFPSLLNEALREIGRKGIALGQQVSVSAENEPALPPLLERRRALTIYFPTAVSRVVLEFEPRADHDLEYEAKSGDESFTGPVPRAPRVTISFTRPVAALTLKGTAFLYGLRVVTSPVGTDPNEVLPRSVVINGVRYKPTAAPPAPLFLGTVNLQTPIVPGAPEVTLQQPPQSLGFRLLWLPPPTDGSSEPLPWPRDLAAFPPFDVVGFHLERRRVDTGTPFVEIDGQTPPTLFFGNRSSRRDPEHLWYGSDLLEIYPEISKPEPPVSVLMEIQDVLVSAANTGPPAGSLHQYRIFSVDAIGRRSASPKLGSIVRLEKRIAPPQPVGPPQPLPPPDPISSPTVPSGVRARLIQASDPELAAADRTLLGTSANAIVLEWGWTQAERERDPYAKEFRVYWQPNPPDVVHGTLIEPVTLTDGFYEMSATLDQAVAEDAMKGRYIVAGSYPFKIAAHTAGKSITIKFEPSQQDASFVPSKADFELRPLLRGDELRPPAWPERTVIVALTEAQSYQHIFRDRVTLDANHSVVRVWVGVSAADDQPYITDEISADRSNGGRPGNESSIVAVAVRGRYFGRPVFTVPPPLADVPEQVTDEPNGETVSVELNLSRLLSGGAIPKGQQISLERLGVDTLVALIAARSDDRIGVTFPDGSTDSYTLANPDDQAAFLAQIRTGTPGRIENRFFMDLVIRYLTRRCGNPPVTPLTPCLESLWQPCFPQPVSFEPVVETLPDKSERYLHRIRLVDAAGHISEGAAILPQVVRVPSLRTPVAPEIALTGGAGGSLTVKARVYDAFDLKWLLLFTLVSEATNAPGGGTLEKAQLLRLPSRRDLYPHNGIRLRLRDGTLLAPAPVVEVAGGTIDGAYRQLMAPLAPGFDKRVSVWAVAMTRDGITSRFAGPLAAFTGAAPLAVPAFTVVSVAGEDRATWARLTVPAEASVERSRDSGASWQRVSPWLPETLTGYNIRSSAGPRQYRLALRASGGRRATSTSVSLP